MMIETVSCVQRRKSVLGEFIPESRGDVGKRNWMVEKEERKHIRKGIAKLVYLNGK
ncbi:MAG: hypothetical protein H5T98_04815 [Syntrophomonadaceae bacterium]|nr:hypothetical protein [Syntrophomonadaceae bacterium]